MITAGYDLGANNRQILKDIILPYLSPGIIAGYFMAFTYSLDDFAVTFFVTGNGFTTLSVEIYSRARRGVSLEINALSTLVFLFALVLVVGYYYISKDNQPRSKKRNGGSCDEKITFTFDRDLFDHWVALFRDRLARTLDWDVRCQSFKHL